MEGLEAFLALSVTGGPQDRYDNDVKQRRAPVTVLEALGGVGGKGDRKKAGEWKNAEQAANSFSRAAGGGAGGEDFEQTGALAYAVPVYNGLEIQWPKRCGQCRQICVFHTQIKEIAATQCLPQLCQY